MKIILDHRERELKLVCDSLIKSNENFKDIKIEIENLELGDMIIKDNENKDILLYERKTVSDLIASIKDGRYEEQSYRLNGLDHHNHNIIYLIEGNINKNFKDKKMVYSAMFSINYYKGFSLMRSSNIEETAYILCNNFIKIKKEKEKDKNSYYKNNKIKTEGESKIEEENELSEEKSYSTVIKKKKNANITQDNFGEIVLCQIPSISSVTAIAIMNKFKTISNLIDELKKDKNILDNITYQTEKNQIRKISKTSIKNIINFLSY